MTHDLSNFFLCKINKNLNDTLDANTHVLKVQGNILLFSKHDIFIFESLNQNFSCNLYKSFSKPNETNVNKEYISKTCQMFYTRFFLFFIVDSLIFD